MVAKQKNIIVSYHPISIWQWLTSSLDSKILEIYVLHVMETVVCVCISCAVSFHVTETLTSTKLKIYSLLLRLYQSKIKYLLLSNNDRPYFKTTLFKHDITKITIPLLNKRNNDIDLYISILTLVLGHQRCGEPHRLSSTGPFNKILKQFDPVKRCPAVREDEVSQIANHFFGKPNWKT